MTGIRAYIGVFIWAGAFVLQAYLPMKTIAMIVFAFCVGAALHALLLRWGVWLFSRKCVRVDWIGPRGGRRLFWLGVGAAGIWYFVSSLRDGNSLFHSVAIEGAYLAGVFLYERRGDVKRELGRRLAPLRAADRGSGDA